MGFMEKFKSLFKKKDKADAPAAKDRSCDCDCKAKKGGQCGLCYASKFARGSAVGDALVFAAEALDKKVEAGMPEAKAKLFFDNLKAIEASADPDDAKLVAVSQVLGQIFRYTNY